MTLRRQVENLLEKCRWVGQDPDPCGVPSMVGAFPSAIGRVPCLFAGVTVQQPVTERTPHD